MKPRTQNQDDYITATLKLEAKMARDFTEALGGQSKNSFIIETMQNLYNVFSDKEQAIQFVYDSLNYTSSRKKMFDNNQLHKLKKSVVSVKLEKTLYNGVMDQASEYGLTFSELIRRMIIKKIEI